MSELDGTEQERLHLQNCHLHDLETRTKCSGRLRKGGSCSHKAMSPSIPYRMPTCKVHQDQVKAITWCRVMLPCGYECKRIFQWEPHQFRICSYHSSQKACYFFKIPIEIRLRIYEYLLPGRDIPAKHDWASFGRGDGDKLFGSILRVNRQIHDEAVDVLYGSRLFHVEVDGDSLSMCNIVPDRQTKQGRLQDYQMQLMLLEQQNQRRRKMARQQVQGGMAAPFATPLSMPLGCNTNPCMMGPMEPIWVPPISFQNFNLITGFCIRIVFAFPYAVTDQKQVEASLYQHTDHLHKLIGRLQLTEKRIRRLQIVIKFTNHPSLTKAEAFSSAEVLLRPFRRLNEISSPAVCSITTTNNSHVEVELLPTWNLEVTGKRFADYVASWFICLSSEETDYVDPPIHDAYWRLKTFMSTIRKHCSHQPKLDEFDDLLHAARVVREEENLPQFREIWDRVVNVWYDYLNYEEEFQSGVAGSIGSMYDMLDASEKGKGRTIDQ